MFAEGVQFGLVLLQVLAAVISFCFGFAVIVGAVVIATLTVATAGWVGIRLVMTRFKA